MCVGYADDADGDAVFGREVRRPAKVDEQVVEEGEAGGQRVKDELVEERGRCER